MRVSDSTRETKEMREKARGARVWQHTKAGKAEEGTVIFLALRRNYQTQIKRRGPQVVLLGPHHHHTNHTYTRFPLGAAGP